MGEGSTQEGSDLPEWMQEQQHEEKTERQEMTFEVSDKEPTEDGGFDPEESQVSNDEEICEDALEQFILKERPSFEDNPLDFP
ncbi:hypothetical protein [Paenibacillus lautus]|uniref:hypothetical protein n=1 Tax=Paenibacillus lautus TaxID=1401 RepID=UPI003D27DDA8